ncbi:MAG: DUF2779 domain-containing protein [Candidatus Paceibacterota bacterium]
MKLTKTDFLIFKDCGKNAWLKVHKPDIYYAKPLSAFDEGIIETGNEVDELARDLFPGGELLTSRDATEETMELVNSHINVIYQPVFETEKYKVVCDIIVWDDVAKVYDLYEVKASNSGDNKKAKDELYSYDIAFQYLVLRELNIPIGKLNLVRLNSEYIRGGDLDIKELFSVEDFTEKVMEIIDDLEEEMKNAYGILSNEIEPFGNCKCITRGRNSHCTTFSYSNPEIPEYSVHDISRIGSSKGKLAELIDSSIYRIEDVPEDFPLSEKQRNQVMATQLNKIYIDKNEINEFLATISTPISFLDYETFAAGVPRFTGYSPFNQIPFQFSLHIVEKEDEEPKHFEFIYTEDKNPDEAFIKALEKYIPKTGHVLVWYKSFEMGRNKDLIDRNPEYKVFLEDLNSRIIDLMDIFTNQHFIHPKFKGKTSIKYVLPVLAPDLSYKALDIKEGATASNTWNQIVTDGYSKEEALEKTKQLLTYCELDTFAMYRIWKYLKEIK